MLYGIELRDPLAQELGKTLLVTPVSDAIVSRSTNHTV